MKKIFYTLVVLAVTLPLSAGVYENLSSFHKMDASGYVKPFVTAAGTSLNSGLYHRARVHGPLMFSFSVNTSIVPIPSSDKRFNVRYDDLDIETATVFGKSGAEAHGIRFPDGFNFDYTVLLIPQVNLGLPLGNELMLRYLPSYSLKKDFGKVEFWGLGVKHSIDQYIPLFPIDWSVQLAYQHLSLGDNIDLSNIALNTHASKNIPILPLTVYGGFGFEETELDSKYIWEFEEIEEEFRLKVKGDNNFRVSAGVRWTVLPFIFVNADVSLAKYNVFNLGLGFSL